MSAPRFARSSIRGRITSTNAEQGNLGTDKSVPYKNRANFVVRAFGVVFCHSCVWHDGYL
ncbi:MAG: hypothetical protein FWG87_03295 [Defluviitaleaceae bacterium]|nr:hypothetical protein [Defluviitaleaceae bacterium]